MHPKAAYLALHGYSLYIFSVAGIGGQQTEVGAWRIMRKIPNEKILGRFIADDGVDHAIWRVTGRAGIEVYLPQHWDEITSEEWENVTQEMIQALIDGVRYAP